MGQLEALVFLVLVTAAIARNVDSPGLKQIRRASTMTRTWRQNNGVGSFNDVGTAGGNTLTKPKVLQCTQKGFFPQPGSCTDFYRCVDWLGTGKYFSTFRFNCPYGTVFDDDLDICNHPAAVRNPPECAGAIANLPLPEPPGVDSTTSSGGQTDDTEPCNGTLAAYPTPETTTVEVTTVPENTLTSVFNVPENTFSPFFETTTSEPDTTLQPFSEETTTAGSMWAVEANSIYPCPAPGYYPFEGDCVRFYKCVETDIGTLKGLLYKCPMGYGYSEERKRCWPEDELPPCQRKLQVAHQRLETATQVYTEDLSWFFNNRK